MSATNILKWKYCGGLLRKAFDVLAIGMVLLMAWHIAEQFTFLMDEPETNRHVASGAKQAVPSATSVLLDSETGQHSLTRTEVIGKYEDVVGLARDQCRRAIQPETIVKMSPWANQERLMRLLQDRTPVETCRGGAVYVVDGPFTIVAATHNSGQSDQRQLAALTMIMPGPEQSWRLFNLLRSLPDEYDVALELDASLPFDCKRDVAAREASGAVIVTFAGTCRIPDAIKHFDLWFEAQNWHCHGEWQTQGTTRLAQFHGPESQSVEILIAPTRSNELVGTLRVTTTSITGQYDQERG